MVINDPHERFISLFMYGSSLLLTMMYSCILRSQGTFPSNVQVLLLRMAICVINSYSIQPISVAQQKTDIDGHNYQIQVEQCACTFDKSWWRF